MRLFLSCFCVVIVSVAGVGCGPRPPDCGKTANNLTISLKVTNTDYIVSVSNSGPSPIFVQDTLSPGSPHFVPTGPAGIQLRDRKCNIYPFSVDGSEWRQGQWYSTATLLPAELQVLAANNSLSSSYKIANLLLMMDESGKAWVGRMTSGCEYRLRIRFCYDDPYLTKYLEVITPWTPISADLASEIATAAKGKALK
jgi:hypothetical protein